MIILGSNAYESVITLFSFLSFTKIVYSYISPVRIPIGKTNNIYLNNKVVLYYIPSDGSSHALGIHPNLMKLSYTRVSRTENERGLVLDDFKQILEAISIFIQVFGDSNIPNKFDVPAEDPWPSSLHGLRLGKRLEKLLSTNEFIEKHPDKLKELAKFGFDPKMRSLVDDWGTIYQTIKVYKELYGDLRVPSKFIVPSEEPWPRLSRNIKLGVRVAAIRSAGRYVKDHPERKAELDQLGFEWRLRDHTHKQQVGEDKFEQVYDALVIYKQHIDENLYIPSTFVIPNDNIDDDDNKIWPNELLGLKLGLLVQSMRNENKFVFGHQDRIDMLNKLNFPWEDLGSRSAYSKQRFELIYEAMIVYKNIYKDLFVPQPFVVPSESPWSESTWGLKLGARVNAIRSHGTFIANSPDRRNLLDDLGFSWELPSEIKRRKKLTEAAQAKRPFDDFDDFNTLDDTMNDLNFNIAANTDTSTFRIRSSGSSSTLNDNSDSETDFLNKVSSITMEEDWQLASMNDEEREMFLTNTTFSNTARRIKDRTLLGRISSSKGVNSGLAYDPSLIFEPIAYREIAAEAVNEYMISREYSSDPNIRQMAHFDGHLTPQAFNSMITRSIPKDDIEAMKIISYRILEFGKFNWDNVVEALTIYKNHFGNINVPQDYIINDVVFDKEIGFNDSLEGLLLGEVVAGIRIGDIDGFEDPERRVLLDNLGFEWGDLSVYQRYRFVPMLLGLKLYKHLYGFPLPQYDFIVPDEPQWPYWMVNMPLGQWATIARIQQQLISDVYPNRKDMLNALEFLWWIPPSSLVPLKYFEPLIL